MLKLCGKEKPDYSLSTAKGRKIMTATIIGNPKVTEADCTPQTSQAVSATLDHEIDWQAVKADFPIFEREINGKPITYLDSTATAQKPRQVIDTLQQFYSQHNANIH